MPTQLTHEILSAAIEGFELQKKRIDGKIAELRTLLGGGHAEPAATLEVPGKRKKFSAGARRKMAQAQKARWAKIKRETESASLPATPEAPKAKRKISPEGIKRIIASQKKRWRLQKAKAAEVSAVVKKASVKKAVVKASSVKATKKVAPMKKSAPAPTAA